MNVWVHPLIPLTLLPRVAAKALELFLAMIVDEASKVTLERSAKKVEAYHLYVFLPHL